MTSTAGLTHADAAPGALPVDDDGEPVSAYAEGDLLPGGHPAWHRLGVGHRCETWLAWSPVRWVPVVVKFPRPHQSGHPRARRSLRREVAALRDNLHPALPRLYDDATGRPVPWIATEHVDGPALDDELDEHGPLGAAETTLLAVQALAALRTVHARGLVHVDLKPANVLLRNGRPVVIDFGSARATGAPQPAGRLIGSAGYAAPELEAGADIDPLMDVYGLGTVLHEARTGEPTFDPDRPAGARPDPAPLPGATTEDRAVAGLVARMLAPDPVDRPSVDDTLLAWTALAEGYGWFARPGRGR